MSTTDARTNITNFSADTIGSNRTGRETIFLNITERCDIMLGHPSSSAEQIAEEIQALRKLALVAAEVAAELERRQQRSPAELERRQQEADQVARDTAARIRGELADAAADQLATVYQIDTAEGSGPVPPDAAGPGVMAAPFARAEDYPHRDTYGKEGPA